MTVAATAASTVSIDRRDDTPTIRWRFADGHAEELSLPAFDDHSDTPSVASLESAAAIAPECRCPKSVPTNSADRHPSPCDDTDTVVSTLALARRETTTRPSDRR